MLKSIQLLLRYGCEDAKYVFIDRITIHFVSYCDSAQKFNDLTMLRKFI